MTEENNIGVKSVSSQYEDAKYSDFVEDQKNINHYNECYHYSFFLKLAPILTKTESVRILDLACGNGILLRKLRRIRHDFEVTGIDQSKAMLLKAEILCAAEGINDDKTVLIQSDVLDLPQDLGLFDCIVSGFFFAHVAEKQHLIAILTSIREHLVDGGLTVHIIPGCPDSAVEGIPTRVLLPVEIPHVEVASDGVTTTLEVEHHEIELYDYYWSPETYIDAARAAGLVDIQFEKGVVSQRGLDMNLEIYIDVYIFSARKPESPN